MADLLEALHNLQEVELKLAEYRRGEDSRTRRIEASRRQLKKIDHSLSECQANLREYQMQIDSHTLEIKAREESTEKHREALSKARTNKEYAAILAALNTEKADNSKIETQVLELMEQRQQYIDRAAELEAERVKIEDRISKVQSELDAYRSDVQEERDALASEREQCAEDIPVEALNTFTRVAEHHDGEAMVPVVKLHPKRQDYVCSGCNMTVTLEIINTLQVGQDLQFCKVCGRLLYMDSQAARSR